MKNFSSNNKIKIKYNKDVLTQSILKKFHVGSERHNEKIQCIALGEKSNTRYAVYAIQKIQYMAYENTCTVFFSPLIALGVRMWLNWN